MCCPPLLTLSLYPLRNVYLCVRLMREPRDLFSMVGVAHDMLRIPKVDENLVEEILEVLRYARTRHTQQTDRKGINTPVRRPRRTGSYEPVPISTRDATTCMSSTPAPRRRPSRRAGYPTELNQLFLTEGKGIRRETDDDNSPHTG